MEVLGKFLEGLGVFITSIVLVIELIRKVHKRGK
jgi:hypothetical protein